MSFRIQSNKAFILDKVMALATQVSIHLSLFGCILWLSGVVRLIRFGWVVVVQYEGNANLLMSSTYYY